MEYKGAMHTFLLNVQTKLRDYVLRNALTSQLTVPGRRLPFPGSRRHTEIWSGRQRLFLFGNIGRQVPDTREQGLCPLTDLSTQTFQFQNIPMYAACTILLRGWAISTYPQNYGSGKTDSNNTYRGTEGFTRALRSVLLWVLPKWHFYSWGKLRTLVLACRVCAYSSYLP